MAAVADDPTVKRITVTVNAAQQPEKPLEGGEPKRRKTRRARKTVEGGSPNSPIQVNKIGSEQSAGGATSPGTLQQLAASHIPGNNISKAVGAVAPLTDSAAPVGVAAPSALNETVGGAKVVLVKPRKDKVVLAAPKAQPALKVQPLKRNNKTAKKVKVSLAGLGKKLRKAKTIRKKATKHGIEEVKKELVKANLIKADSKAPEDILRQMYHDYMVLKTKAL